MPVIINWPNSQACMDCKHAHWLTANEEDDIIYPALVCETEHYPEGSECTKWQFEYETVELIAAGYEWTCPACDTLITIIETTESVTCKACKRRFKVDSYAHVHP